MILIDVRNPMDDLIESINHTYYMCKLIEYVEKGVKFQTASEMAAKQSFEDSITTQVQYIKDNNCEIE